MIINKRKNVLATFIGLLAAGATVQTTAQSDTNSQATAQRALDEIIVTAQKKQQSLQEVPIAITALGSDAMSARGIESVADFQFSVPGLVAGETTFGQAQITVRGVGLESINPIGGDPGVPIHIDGHYIQASSYALRDMFDIDRVEVLRGPQGTLYGRNAIGGTVNIITERPSTEVEGMVSLNMGNYNRQLLQGMVSGPISENLRARIAVSDESRDGFVENVSVLAATNGDEWTNSEYTMLRGSLEYDLTNNVKILFSAFSYQDQSISPALVVYQEYPDNLLFSGFVPNPYLAEEVGENVSVSDPRKVNSDLTPKNDNDAEGASLNIDWELNRLTFRSLTAYNDSQVVQSDFDLDGSDAVFTDRDSIVGFETWTQEFQLLSNKDSEVGWVAGVFYYNEKSTYFLNIDLFSIFGPGNPPTEYFVTLSGNDPAEAASTSIALYGQLDYSLADNLQLIAGLRLTHDKKEIEQGIKVVDFGLITSSGEPITSKFDDDWTEMTWKVGLNYFLNDTVMLYTDVSTGYKAGGYNADGGLQNTAYDPETITALQAGFKSRFLDGRVQINAEGYYYDYKDKQEAQIEGISTVFRNAASATSYGLEFELQAKVTDALLIDTSFTYQNAEYDDFITDDPLNVQLGPQNLKGNKVSRSPELKVYLGLQYDWISNLGLFSGRVDYSWVDDQYFRPYNAEVDRQKSYHRSNARIDWISNQEAWSASMYVKNIEDDNIRANQLIFAEILGSVVSAQFFSPRTYGLEVKYNF